MRQQITLGMQATNDIPNHIAIIMDGNGRWANARGLPRAEGRRAGAESVREAVETCRQLGVNYLTLYAFRWDLYHRGRMLGFLNVTT